MAKTTHKASVGRGRASPSGKTLGGEKSGPSGPSKALRAPPPIRFSRQDIEPYDEVARLIAGRKRDVPSWFSEHLRRWASSLFLDAAVHRRQPRRAEVTQHLKAIQHAAEFLHDSLGRGPLIEFLDSQPAGKFLARGLLVEELKQLAERAEHALKSPGLVTRGGVTKAGRGRALPPGATIPEAYCAALIAEAWKYIRGEEVASGNKYAQMAAAALWAAAGAGSFRSNAAKGPRTETHEPEKRWRSHLEKAASPELSIIRAEFRGHMIELARIFQRRGEENGAINPAEKS